MDNGKSWITYILVTVRNIPNSCKQNKHEKEIEQRTDENWLGMSIYEKIETDSFLMP